MPSNSEISNVSFDDRRLLRFIENTVLYIIVKPSKRAECGAELEV